MIKPSHFRMSIWLIMRLWSKNQNQMKNFPLWISTTKRKRTILMKFQVLKPVILVTGWGDGNDPVCYLSIYLHVCLTSLKRIMPWCSQHHPRLKSVNMGFSFRCILFRHSEIFCSRNIWEKGLRYLYSHL